MESIKVEITQKKTCDNRDCLGDITNVIGYLKDILNEYDSGNIDIDTEHFTLKINKTVTME